jgi:hypothetical protein
MRKHIEPEEVFYNHVRMLLRNLFVSNRNYDNGYYSNKTRYDIIQDTKERAIYILGVMEEEKHLLNLEDKEVD